MTSPSRSRISDPNASQVVLVGTAHYASKNLADLPAVEKNLEALRSALATGPWRLPPERCRVILDPAAPGVVLEHLHRAAANADDTLVFYFAGHGLLDPLGSDDQLVLALTHSDPDNQRHWHSLSYSAIRRMLIDPAATRAKRKVVILDCCYAGLATGQGDTDTLGGSVAITGTYVLTATSATSKALSPPGETYTAFTGALLKVHEQGIPNAGRVLDMNTIYQHLVQTLPSRGLPRPQQLNHDLGGKIAFIYNAAWTDEDSELEPPITSRKSRLRSIITPAVVRAIVRSSLIFLCALLIFAPLVAALIVVSLWKDHQVNLQAAKATITTDKPDRRLEHMFPEASGHRYIDLTFQLADTQGLEDCVHQTTLVLTITRDGKPDGTRSVPGTARSVPEIRLTAPAVTSIGVQIQAKGADPTCSMTLTLAGTAHDLSSHWRVP